jgi:hypothetical protein
MKTTWPAIFLILALSACGSDEDKTSQNAPNLSGFSYTTLAGASLTQDAEGISGSGRILFLDPLSESIESGRNLKFTAVLPDQGQMTVSLYADTELSQGLDFVFSRMGDLLKGSIAYADEAVDISDKLSQTDITKAFTLSLDAHNDEQPAHIIMWDLGEEGEESEDNEIMNSEEDGLEIPGNGSGIYWGIELTDAKLTFLNIGDGVHEDEE